MVAEGGPGVQPSQHFVSALLSTIERSVEDANEEINSI